MTTVEQKKKPRSIVKEMMSDVISFVQNSDINLKVNGIEIDKQKENDFINIRIATKKSDAKQTTN